MLAILNFLTALELVVLRNQLAVTGRKLVQTVSQALQFMFGEVILRPSRCREILVLQWLRHCLPAILQPDYSGYAAAKGDWSSSIFLAHRCTISTARSSVRSVNSSAWAQPFLTKNFISVLRDVQIFPGRLPWIGRQPEKKRRKHLRCQVSLSFRGWLKIHGIQILHAPQSVPSPYR